MGRRGVHENDRLMEIQGRRIMRRSYCCAKESGDIGKISPSFFNALQLEQIRKDWRVKLMLNYLWIRQKAAGDGTNPYVLRGWN